MSCVITYLYYFVFFFLIFLYLTVLRNKINFLTSRSLSGNRGIVVQLVNGKLVYSQSIGSCEILGQGIFVVEKKMSSFYGIFGNVT